MWVKHQLLENSFSVRHISVITNNTFQTPKNISNTNNIIYTSTPTPELTKNNFQTQQNISNSNNIVYTPQQNKTQNIYRNITTSSLQKREIKQTHCKYCHSNKTNKTLENHLKENSHCKSMYQRLFKVNCIEAIILSCFKCLNCSDNSFVYLKSHLHKKNNCFNYYKMKFKVTNMKELLHKIANYKRQSQPSRQPVNRHLDYATKTLNQETVTITESINKYRNCSIQQHRKSN